MKLSTYASAEIQTIFCIAVILCLSCLLLQLWWVIIPIVMIALALLAFFRDPERRIPSDRQVIIAPADGKISSIHTVTYHEAFNESAICVRIFLSVLHVHVVRSPCHAKIVNITHRPGKYINVLKPESAEENEALTLELAHPTSGEPIASIRFIAGMLARTICCPLTEGQVIQRGQRIGIFKLGSTVELYLPASSAPEILFQEGQNTRACETILARLLGSGADTVSHITQTTPDILETPEVFASEILDTTDDTDSDDDNSDSDDYLPTPSDTLDDSESELESDSESDAEEDTDLTEHAVRLVSSEDADTLLAEGHEDGEYLVDRMEIAGTDLMLMPEDHGEENPDLVSGLMALRPDSHEQEDESADNGDSDSPNTVKANAPKSVDPDQLNLFSK